MLKQISTLAAVAGLGACASLPDVTYHYYQPRSVSTVSVTQTLQCVQDMSTASGSDDKAKAQPKKYTELDVVTTVVAPSTTYSADHSQGSFPLRIRDVDGPLSDTDAGFTFLEDGRLAGINAGMTGEGETILKSAISLGTAAAGFGAVGLNTMALSTTFKIAKTRMIGFTPVPPAKPSATDVCRLLSGWPGADKGLALTFTRNINLEPEANSLLAYDVQAEMKRHPERNFCRSANDLAATRSGIDLTKPRPQPTFVLNDPDTYSDISVSDPDLYKLLEKEQVSVPKVTATIGDVHATCRVETYEPANTSDAITLKLQDTDSVRLDYYVNSDGKDGWSGSSLVAVPVRGSLYDLAVPKGAPFGNSKVVLTLVPSGAVTALEYSKTNGSAGAMNVAGAALTAATPAPASTTQQADTNPGTHAGDGGELNSHP